MLTENAAAPSMESKSLHKYSYLMMAVHMCNDMNAGALAALLPFLIMAHGFDYTAAAGLTFAVSFLSSLVQPALGMMTDRKSMPWLMIVGMACCCFGVAIVGFIDSYWLIFASVTFSGLGGALFHPEAARMANHVAGEHKGRGMSIFTAGGNIGFILGPFLVTAAVSAVGLRGTAILFLPAFISILVFLLLQKRLKPLFASMAAEKRLVASSGQKDDMPAFLKLCGPVFARSILNNGLNTFIPLFWVAVLMKTEKQGSLMVTVMAVAIVFTTLISGYLADRFGFRKVFCCAFGLSLPLILLLTLTQNVLLAAVIVIVAAAAVSSVYAPAVALGQKYLPNQLGLASGVTLGLSISVGGIFSPVLGKIGDHFGLYPVLYVLAGIALFGLLTSLLIKEPERGTVDPEPEIVT